MFQQFAGRPGVLTGRRAGNVKGNLRKKERRKKRGNPSSSRNVLNPLPDGPEEPARSIFSPSREIPRTPHSSPGQQKSSRPSYRNSVRGGKAKEERAAAPTIGANDVDSKETYLPGGPTRHVPGPCLLISQAAVRSLPWEESSETGGEGTSVRVERE